MQVPRNTIRQNQHKVFGYIEALVLLPIFLKIILSLFLHIPIDIDIFYIPIYIMAIKIDSLRLKQTLLLTQLALTIYSSVFTFSHLDVNTASYTFGYIFLISLTFIIISQQEKK